MLLSIVVAETLTPKRSRIQGFKIASSMAQRKIREKWRLGMKKETLRKIKPWKNETQITWSPKNPNPYPHAPPRYP